MAIINGYITLAEFKAELTPPRQTLQVDTVDDRKIEDTITAASRRVDDLMTGRVFYPYVQTYAYDVPEENLIKFGADLLALTTLTNGNSTVLTSTDYILMPANVYPKHSIKLRDTSAYFWEMSSAGSIEQVITVLGFWGYHEQYATRAWKQVGTLGAAWESTSTLTATLTSGYSLDIKGGEIIKIDNEILQTDYITTTTMTVQARGDNGSTAATHLISAPVYVWQPMADIKQLTLEITKIMYRSRYGENVETNSTYTSSGVIVTPRSLPVWAQEVISRYKKTL